MTTFIITCTILSLITYKIISYLLDKKFKKTNQHKNQYLRNVSKYTNNSFELRKKHIKPKLTDNEAQHKILNEAVCKYLHKGSILRSYFPNYKIQSNESYNFVPNQRFNYIYKDGSMFKYNLNPHNTYEMPFTNHFYSVELNQYEVSKNTAYNDNLIYLAGVEGGDHLANLENKLFIDTLLEHKESTYMYDIPDSISVYKACEYFKTNNVKNYSILLPHSDPYIHDSNLIQEIKSSLNYKVKIKPYTLFSTVFDLYNLSAILIEETPDLTVQLVQKGYTTSLIAEYKKEKMPYLEILTNINIIISGLKSVTFCFKSDTIQDMHQSLNITT